MPKPIRSLRSEYYGFVKRMNKPAKDLELSKLIRECQAETKQTYGYRRVAIWLERRGVHHNPKTILRVMNKYSRNSIKFQSTLPVWGVTAKVAKKEETYDISIHTPRVGSD